MQVAWATLAQRSGFARVRKGRGSAAVTKWVFQALQTSADMQQQVLLNSSYFHTHLHPRLCHLSVQSGSMKMVNVGDNSEGLSLVRP